MESRLRLLLSLLLTLTASLFAQDDPKFKLSATLEPASAAPGDAVVLVLRATTAAGWHAYGTSETAELELTGLKLAGSAAIPPAIPEISPYGTTFPLPQSFQVTVPLEVAAGATGKLPAVLVVHENRGLNPYIQDVVRRTAKAGFLALGPDGLTPLGGYPGNDDDGRTMQRQLDRAKLMEDFFAGFLDQLNAVDDDSAVCDFYLPVEFEEVVEVGDFKIGSAPSLLAALDDMRDEIFSDADDDDAGEYSDFDDEDDTFSRPLSSDDEGSTDPQEDYMRFLRKVLAEAVRTCISEHTGMYVRR